MNETDIIREVIAVGAHVRELEKVPPKLCRSDKESEVQNSLQNFLFSTNRNHLRDLFLLFLDKWVRVEVEDTVKSGGGE